MADLCAGIVEQDAVRVLPPDPDTQLRLLTADRDGAHPTERRVEAVDPTQDGTAEGHVAADEVAHWGDPRRLTGEAAPDHPVELAWQPGRTRPVPLRHGLAANSQHIGVLVVPQQPGQPVALSLGVVVEEGDDVAAGVGHAGVARSGEPAWAGAR